jgi:hypothetical protein
MAEILPPAASADEMPWFMAAPGETDTLTVVMGLILVMAVVTFGLLFFRLHTLPERMAHKSKKIQLEIVAVLGLIALFTHMHIFWVASLLLAESLRSTRPQAAPKGRRFSGWIVRSRRPLLRVRGGRSKKSTRRCWLLVPTYRKLRGSSRKQRARTNRRWMNSRPNENFNGATPEMLHSATLGNLRFIWRVARVPLPPQPLQNRRRKTAFRASYQLRKLVPKRSVY